jgi:hypothetical protein
MPDTKQSPAGPASAPAAEPETLSAILAEMREISVTDWANLTPRLVHELADRIEAAAERERDEDRQLSAIAESDEAFARCARCDRPERAPGNVAAMHKALEWVADVGVEDDYGADGQNLAIAAEKARAALAAPARNCDRFATEDEAREAYWAYRDPLEFNDKPFVSITEWLFAPAEGGDHA